MRAVEGERADLGLLERLEAIWAVWWVFFG